MHSRSGVINTDAQLNEFIGVVKNAKWVALDTEADSLHAYPEKLCLIQFSTPTENVLIDPLAGLDLQPLFASLANHELILHAADYDLRLLHGTFQFRPSAVFDTMFAARLVGFREYSLHRLVKKLAEIELEKGSQKANWGQRPLTRKMEEYAINDVRYLNQVALQLKEQLKASGRLSWHKEICQKAIRDSTQGVQPDPDQVWRLKGSNKLDRRGLSLLRAMWQWRESEAILANKPPYFILSHEIMLSIAEEAAANRQWKKRLPDRLSIHRQRGLEKAVNAANQLTKEEWPTKRRGTRRHTTEEEKARAEQIKATRDKVASELDLDPTLIASRATISLLAQDWDKNRGQLMKWQQQLLNGDCGE